MGFKKFLTDFIITFAVTLVVAVMVSFLYSLVAHGEGVVDGGTALRLAVIFGIVLPLTRPRAK